MKSYSGIELEKLKSKLEAEHLNTFKEYNFKKASQALEQEIKYSHKSAWIGESQCNKFKKIQSQSNYILNLQYMLNTNVEAASWYHKSQWSIARDENYELMHNSVGQIIPSWTIRANFDDGEYSLSYPLNDDCSEYITTNKVVIKNGLYDLKSALIAADEIINLMGDDRHRYIESFEKLDKQTLEISFGS